MSRSILTRCATASPQRQQTCKQNADSDRFSISLETHRAQRLNYPKATGLHFYLPPNFGKPHLGIKRTALSP